MNPDNRLTIAYIGDYPTDAARALENLPGDTIAELLGNLDRKDAGRLVENMMPDIAATSLGHCDIGLAEDLLESIPATAAARILRSAAAHQDIPLYRNLLERGKTEIHRLTRYPLDRVGGHMQHASGVFPEDMKPRDVLKRMRWRKVPSACEIWLVDRGHRLSGEVQIADLLQADADDTLRHLMRAPRMALPVRMPLGVARAQPAWDTYRRLPVTDDDDILVGVIEYNTLVQATRSEVEPAAQPDAMDSLFALARIYWTAIAAIFDTLFKSEPTYRIDHARRENEHGR